MYLSSFAKKGILLGLLACITSMGCTPDFSKALPEKNKFFDLKSYFQQEKLRLKNVNGFTKKTTIDKSDEVHHFDTLNLVEELQIFENSDINRIAWFDKYSTDSIFVDTKIRSIHYKALDPKLKTQEIKIDFGEDGPSKIHINNLSVSTILESTQKLFYQPLIGYTIESWQKMILSEEKEVIVDVQFDR